MQEENLSNNSDELLWFWIVHSSRETPLVSVITRGLYGAFSGQSVVSDLKLAEEIIVPDELWKLDPTKS